MVADPTDLLGSTGVLAQIAADLQTGTAASLANVTGADAQALTAAITQVSDQAADMGANYQRVLHHSRTDVLIGDG